MAESGSDVPCRSYEVIHRNDRGEFTKTPVSAGLTASGRMPVQVATVVLMVERHGWPAALRTYKHHTKNGRSKNRIISKGDGIFLLKCFPACWRLYFYVDSTGTESRLIYLHAVCKKGDTENPEDAKYAGRVRDRIIGRDSGITYFPVEPD